MDKLLILSVVILTSGCMTIPSDYTFSGGKRPIIIEINVHGLEDFSKNIKTLSKVIE